MSVFKCKMCGGSLEVSDDSVIAVCDYCGIKQTVPLADNDKKMMMFDRANKLRFLCEFDKAAVVYESIVSDFPYEAEAYWGLILCKYGIEYVDDPSSGKKVPTCHRSSFESVLEDENFEQVMENADPAAVSVYRDEAKVIENLRKNILEITSKEEPYDTVEAVGMNDKEQCDVDGWKDIVAISASYTHTVGLKQDGTVVAVGDKSDGRCNVSEWRDIVSISAGNSHTLGLKADGTIVGTGNNGYRQLDIEKWNNVVSIVAGDERSFALINDGTVASTFSNRAQKLDFSSWENIISFNSWDYLSVGIRKDNRIKPIYDDRWTSDTFLTKLSSALDQLYDIAYADI